MEIDYSDLDKIYMIRNTRTNKHVGFRLQSGKSYPYKNYGSAQNYIKKHANDVSQYKIDVFVCVHKDLPEEVKDMYK